MIRRFSIGYDVQLHKRTLERGLLSLLGPESAAVGGRRELGEPSTPTRPSRSAASQARAIRTDLGVDLLCDAADTAALRAALADAGAVPVSGGGRRVPSRRARPPPLRRRPRRHRDPPGGGLNERAVSFTKGCYVGQETVARLHYRGKPNRQLRGLRLPSAAATGDELAFDGPERRAAGSVAGSPRFGPIALALVRREAPAGSAVAVGDDGAAARSSSCRSLALIADSRELVQRARAPAPARAPAAACPDVTPASSRRSAPRRPRRAARGRRARRAALAAARARPRCARSSSSRPLGQRSPVDEPPADQPERIDARAPPGAERAPAEGGRGWPRARPRAGRGSHRAAGPGGAASRALEALLARPRRASGARRGRAAARRPSPPSTNSRSASSSRRR